MIIEIKNNVKDYLMDRNIQDIYIEMVNKGGCCSGPVFTPEVKLGKPSNLEGYDSFIKDEFTLYLPKVRSIEESEKITIKLRNFLGTKSLIVNGVLAYKAQTWEKKKI